MASRSNTYVSDYWTYFEALLAFGWIYIDDYYLSTVLSLIFPLGVYLLVSEVFQRVIFVEYILKAICI